MIDTLGSLADPLACTEEIDLKGADSQALMEPLRRMLLIRYSEEKIGEMVTAGQIVCPCHLAIGQEAVAVGVASELRDSDRAFGTHRSHSHYLAMGGSVEGLMGEVLGKATGCSKGMGGSMHLYDDKNGFKGSIPIVAGTVSLAVGAALAAQLDAKVLKKTATSNMDVGVAFFGDGAVEEGTVHESLNFASQFQLPMLFVCENNLFSSHLHIKLRQPADITARFAHAHRMAVEVVDGNDIVAVQQAAQRLLTRARSGQGPGYLEAVTYRHRGHVGPREDDDVGLKRGEDLCQWKKRDPVERLIVTLNRHGVTAEKLESMKNEVRSEVEDAWAKAERAPFPTSEALLDMVYAPHSGRA